MAGGYYKNWGLAICFVTAICCKALLQYHYYAFSDDVTFQAAAAQSIAAGNGLRVPLVHAQDLSTLVYVPLLAWPPGYSFLLLPFYWFTHDLVKSSLLLNFAATISFFTVYLFLLRKLKLPHLLIRLLLLFNGVFITQDVVYSAPTDLIALTCLLLALAYFTVLSQRTAVRISAGFWLALLCFLPALFRYLYLPVAFAIPPLLYWQGWYSKDRQRLKAGAVALAGTALFCFALLYYLKSNSGFTGNNPALQAASFSFHFSNIQYMHPFLFSSFVNLDFVMQQASKVTGYSYEAIQYFLTRFHFFVLFFTVVLPIPFAIKRNLFAKQNRDRLFFSAGLLIGFFIIGFLFFLSLTTPLIISPDSNATWTYVQEERYFNFIAVFLPLAAFYFIKKDMAVLKRWRRVLFYGLTFLIAAETAHGFYFIVGRVLPGTQLQEQAVFENKYRPFLKPFIEAHEQSGTAVVLGGAINPYFWHARGYPVKPLLNMQELNKPLYATRPVVLLVAVQQAMLPRYTAFLKKSGVKQEWKYNKLYFFSLYVTGHE